MAVPPEVTVFAGQSVHTVDAVPSAYVSAKQSVQGLGPLHILELPSHARAARVTVWAGKPGIAFTSRSGRAASGRLSIKPAIRANGSSRRTERVDQTLIARSWTQRTFVFSCLTCYAGAGTGVA